MPKYIYIYVCVCVCVCTIQEKPYATGGKIIILLFQKMASEFLPIKSVLWTERKFNMFVKDLRNAIWDTGKCVGKQVAWSIPLRQLSDPLARSLRISFIHVVINCECHSGRHIRLVPLMHPIVWVYPLRNIQRLRNDHHPYKCHL